MPQESLSELLEQRDELDRRIAATVDAKDQDPALEQLVLMANHGICVSITLTVGGAIVSGTLVGGREYFEAMKEGIQSAARPAMGEKTSALLASLYDRFRELYPIPIGGTPPSLDTTAEQETASDEEAEDNPEDKKKSVVFIHLKDARFFHTNAPLPTNSGLWWRGRLSEVAGFSLGVFSVAPDSSQ